MVTGLGVVSSIGVGVGEFHAGLRAGRSGISRITAFDTSGFPHDQACEVKNFDPRPWVKRTPLDGLGRSSRFAIAAARMAAEDAGLDHDELREIVCGVSVGTTDGESHPIERLTEEWLTRGPQGLTGSRVLQVPADRLSMTVARELRLSGEAVTISTACAAGNYAIGHAYDLIRVGEADAMLCGGADSLSRKTYAGFFRLGTISPTTCQPFDRNRQGILTGEGSGMLFLESLDRAEDRGARIYAEVLGYGITCDAVHMVAPDSESIANAIRLAHAAAGIAPEDVDYISAHGTGTRVNDAVEAKALREVFGERVPPTSSIKSMIGHTMGAASALAAVACALAIYYGFMPPTINSAEPDPECGIDCIPNEARSCELSVVQNNAFAFGGNNAIVIFGRRT